MPYRASKPACWIDSIADSIARAGGQGKCGGARIRFSAKNGNAGRRQCNLPPARFSPPVERDHRRRWQRIRPPFRAARLFVPTTARPHHNMRSRSAARLLFLSHDHDRAISQTETQLPATAGLPAAAHAVFRLATQPAGKPAGPLSRPAGRTCKGWSRAKLIESQSPLSFLKDSP